ncbi:homeobox transcription [Fusarium albosuccineum]|uniref:Homeobox transcription n=1 Tax=Fusarium albosuccineum TaxID=1237068 RepID=A0A8H4PJT0_9HYPO|nr:homeobox transcription [Fusarium albosuccineum]
MGSYHQPQWSSWGYHNTPNHYPRYSQQLPSYAAYLPESMELYNAHQGHLLHHHQMSRTTETKPRLFKEEVEVLEAEFQKNHKPNSTTKKALAESMRVDNARINNWFQNRRAREKKEKNIREYAAKQKLEKDKAANEAGAHSDDDQQPDRVVSTAPFPAPRPLKTLDADLSTPEHDSESDASPSDFSACSPPGVSAQATPEPASASTTVSLSGYSHYPQLIIPAEEDQPTPSLSQDCFTISSRLSSSPVQEQYVYSNNSLAINDASQASMMSLKPSPSMDIASRRNRRAPQIAINASRSYSACAPRTGIDLGRRTEVGHSMRRVSSATGVGRISKPSGGPRSPYFDRNPDMLLQLNRSPNFTGATATIAPPTPNTPVVATQPGLCEPTPSGTVAYEEKYSLDLAIHDPTLRTPPTTPGVMDNLYNADAAYEVAVSDEPLVTPGLGGFPNDFEIPGASNQVPNYISASCSSQPQTPSYGAHMGPAYFGYSGGNPEYNWSDDASASANSSPGQSQRNVQFMNMTPSSFTYSEK